MSRLPMPRRHRQRHTAPHSVANAAGLRTTDRKVAPRLPLFTTSQKRLAAMIRCGAHTLNLNRHQLQLAVCFGLWRRGRMARCSISFLYKGWSTRRTAPRSTFLKPSRSIALLECNFGLVSHISRPQQGRIIVYHGERARRPTRPSRLRQTCSRGRPPA